MRKTIAVAAGLLMFVSLGSAQMKGKSVWHCDAAGQQKQFDAGDQPGHAFAVAQGNCTATSSTMGEKTGQYTQTEEINGDKTKSRGSFVVTTEDGDKIFYSYDEDVDLAKKTGANTLKITGGTGKHANHKASGSCKGKFNDDDSSDWTCSIGSAMAAKMKSKSKM